MFFIHFEAIGLVLGFFCFFEYFVELIIVLIMIMTRGEGENLRNFIRTCYLMGNNNGNFYV